MQKLLVSLLAVAAIFGTIYVYQQQNSSYSTSIPTPVYDAWVHWKNMHQKQYSPAEEKQKLSIWYANYIKITSHNQRNDKTYSLGFNKFMDLTTEQFKTVYLTLGEKNTYEPVELDESAVPASFDWRTKGGVTPVKDQAQCGSCWAFSTTGSLEGAHFVSTGNLTSFSEQQLVDCSTSFGNNGCNGGLMDYAFQYVQKNGITTEDKYRYTAVDQTCRSTAGVWKISSFNDVPKRSDSQLKAALVKQPVSIAVDAEAWQFYTGGVFSDCGSSLDHGVLLVAYQAQDFWVVKNSWGPTWGESGFIRLKMGNTCGLENQASYPVA